MLAPWLVAGCERDPFAPPPVTASFVTPEYFHLAVAGEDAAEAPGLRNTFFKEVEAFARANGCTGYRVLEEVYQTSASVSPWVSTDPSIIFGRRPTYYGLIECRLAPITGQASAAAGQARAATPPRAGAPTRLFP
jgi:hypothetical protein